MPPLRDRARFAGTAMCGPCSRKLYRANAMVASSPDDFTALNEISIWSEYKIMFARLYRTNATIRSA